jgi:formylmethanofuran:tetrahydromethanopterin formyltransferase
MKEFAFEVGLVARVRVRAADEASARRAVPSVIGAPSSAEIALANQGIDVLLPGVMVDRR